MKLQLASDLHLERLPRMLDPSTVASRIVVPAGDAEVLVLAGDIHGGAAAIAAFADWPVPVVYVAGNHEFYGGVWEDTRAELRRLAAGTRVRFLDNEVFELGRVRFLGCTLWTDFSWPGMTQEQCMQAVDADLDRHRMSTRTGPLRSRQLLADHQRSRCWLEQESARPHDGFTVVVSHHAPHRNSIHPRHAGSRLNAAFASDLPLLLDRVDLWLHGHVHDSVDYRVGRCRVVANPAGYAVETRDGISSAPTLNVENAAFDRELVLEGNAAFDRTRTDGTDDRFAAAPAP